MLGNSTHHFHILAVWLPLPAANSRTHYASCAAAIAIEIAAEIAVVSAAAIAVVSAVAIAAEITVVSAVAIYAAAAAGTTAGLPVGSQLDEACEDMQVHQDMLTAAAQRVVADVGEDSCRDTAIAAAAAAWLQLVRTDPTTAQCVHAWGRGLIQQGSCTLQLSDGPSGGVGAASDVPLQLALVPGLDLLAAPVRSRAGVEGWETGSSSHLHCTALHCGVM